MLTTDSGKKYVGAEKAIVGEIYKASEMLRCLRTMVIYHISHQQMLCGKHSDLSSDTEPVVSMMNFFAYSVLNHHQLCKSFCQN